MQFMAWGNAVRDRLITAGYWCDFCDPASGYPVHSERGGMTCNDVDLCLRCLKYRTVDLGCCKMISHPRWKTAVYPATMVAVAPIEALEAALQAEM